MINHLSRNVKIAYVLSFLGELYFPVSIWLFYYLRFLDFKQIGILTAVKLISQNLFEVPTGVFADVMGRKTSVFISFFLYALVMLGMANISVFWMFIVLDILKALSNAFLSGSMEALVYDSLKQDKKENEYDKVVANMESIAWIGLFISSTAGGFAYFYWYRSPYVIQGVLYLAAAVIALGLTEPNIINTQKYNLKDSLKLNFAGFSELFGNKNTALISSILITIGGGYFIASEMLGMAQAREYGLDSRGAGLLFSSGYIISAIASQYYPKLRKLIGARKILILTTTILLASFLLAKWVGMVVGALLIVARISSSTTFRNVRSSIINARINSKTRATTISTLTLLSQLPLGLMAYFLGGYIDSHSPNSLAWVLGIAILTILIGQAVVLRR